MRVRRDARPEVICSLDGAQRNPGIIAAIAVPDYAEFIIGRAFRATRWLRPGYGIGV
jgi:hypothetical protein